MLVIVIILPGCDVCLWIKAGAQVDSSLLLFLTKVGTKDLSGRQSTHNFDSFEARGA